MAVVDSAPVKKREKKQGSSSEPKSRYTLPEMWWASLDHRWVDQLQAKGLPLEPKPEINDLQLKARAAAISQTRAGSSGVEETLSQHHHPCPCLPNTCVSRSS